MYTKAIEECPKNHKLFSNRFSAHYKMDKFAHALDDAKKCTSIND